MDGFYLLTALSIAMFVGSFLAGLIPLAFVMSEGRTRLLSTFGAGLLVGTALSVIIPEGVESLYTAEAERRALIGSWKEVGERNKAHPNEAPAAIKKLVQVTENLSGIYENKLEDTDIVKRKVRELPSDPIFAAGSSMERKHEHSEAEAEIAAISPSIGYSLVIGFIFMFIIDQISRSLSYKGGERLRYKLTATIGLVVHAAADGIALGSASATNRTDVQFIVFLAVMLHKAPAAFGLVSFLLVEGVERFRIRRHLFAFSIAAPLAALLTYYLIVAVGSETLSADSATGVLMLFSAGTFLYVATVHILPELVNSGIGGYQLVNSAVESGGHTHGLAGGPLPFKELASVIVGAICPTLLASGHSH